MARHTYVRVAEKVFRIAMHRVKRFFQVNKRGVDTALVCVDTSARHGAETLKDSTQDQMPVS